MINSTTISMNQMAELVLEGYGRVREEGGFNKGAVGLDLR